MDRQLARTKPKLPFGKLTQLRMTRRSRFGCQTCKIRKIKCDETQPFCKRCTETGRRCEGPPKNKAIFLPPATSRQQRHPLITPSLHQIPFQSPPSSLSTHNVQEGGKRALSFYLECIVPTLGGNVDHAFWGETVLQMCHKSSTLQNAVLALSTLCETPLKNPLQWPTSIEVNFPEPIQRKAFGWYSQSLSNLSGVFDQADDHETLCLALVSCIIVACVEVQQLNVVNSLKLMTCGYNLLRQEGVASLVIHSSLIRDEILPIFIQQTIILSLHGYSLPDGWLPAHFLELNNHSTSITTLKDARTQLHLIMLDPLFTVNRSETVEDPETWTKLQRMRCGLLEKLGDWHRRFECFITTFAASSLFSVQALSLQWAQYWVAVIWSSTCLSDSEMIYDDYLPQFTYTLQHIDRYMTDLSASTTKATYNYSFETRVIPYLYFVGWRCRDPRMRRGALHLLKKAPAQENLFHRDVQIWALRRIIQLEEGLPPNYEHMMEDNGASTNIPGAANRLRHAIVRWKLRGGMSEPYLVYSQWPLQEDGEGTLRPLAPPSACEDEGCLPKMYTEP